MGSNYEHPGVKARIQQWENAGEGTLSLNRKDLRNRSFRKFLYSDSSSLRRRPPPPQPSQPTNDLRQWQQYPQSCHTDISGGNEDRGRRLRMASTGSLMDASDVLAAALEQMDGIIAGSKFDMQNASTDYDHSLSDWWQPKPARSTSSAKHVARMLEEVKVAVESADDRDEVKDTLPKDVLDFLRDWLISNLVTGTATLAELSN
nr:hypothetical protein BaRGS_002664 [Batillaria attramentaria]